jgi:hypothetical protein
MKSKILILLIALLPIATFAGAGDKKEKKLDVHITLDKKGKVEVNLPVEMKELETDINNALKDVTVKVDDGKKHDVHIKVKVK